MLENFKTVTEVKKTSSDEIFSLLDIFCKKLWIFFNLRMANKEVEKNLHVVIERDISPMICHISDSDSVPISL